MARVLFASGYACRYNVDVVSAYDGGPHSQLTDVDVLAIRFDPLLESAIAIADCKSGRDGSPKERLFWLSGVKSRYNANVGYFVKTKVETTRLQLEYRGLGLRVVSDETLQAMEELSSAARFAKVGPVGTGSIVEADTALRSAKEANRGAYNYLKFQYWQDPVEIQLETTLAIIKDLHQKPARYARLMALSLTSVAALRIANDAVLATPARRDEQIRVLAAGGGANMQTRKDQLEWVHKFTKTEIEKQTRRSWPVSKETFLSFVEAPHVSQLVELTNRLIRNPAAHVLPQALDILAHESGIQERKPDFTVLLNGQVTIDLLRQAVGDIVTFAERVGALTGTERQELLSIL